MPTTATTPDGVAIEGGMEFLLDACRASKQTSQPRVRFSVCMYVPSWLAPVKVDLTTFISIKCSVAPSPMATSTKPMPEETSRSIRPESRSERTPFAYKAKRDCPIFSACLISLAFFLDCQKAPTALASTACAKPFMIDWIVRRLCLRKRRRSVSTPPGNARVSRFFLKRERSIEARFASNS